MNKKFIIFKGSIITITQDSDGLWYDDNNTIYAYSEPKDSVDTEVRAGIGWFSLPSDSLLSAYSRGHDHAYSSPAYQAFHTRKEADEYLEACLKLCPGYDATVVPELFTFLSRMFGSFFWENKQTNI